MSGTVTVLEIVKGVLFLWLFATGMAAAAAAMQVGHPFVPPEEEAGAYRFLRYMLASWILWATIVLCILLGNFHP